MQKIKKIIYTFLLVFALLLSNLPTYVSASGNQIKVVFTPSTNDQDKAWRLHMWIPDTQHVYSVPFEKNNNVFEVNVNTAQTTRVGYVIYHDNWEKELGNTDRFADVANYSTIHVTQGDPNANVVHEQVSELTIHYQKDPAHAAYDFNLWVWYDGSNGEQVNFQQNTENDLVAKVLVKGRKLNQIGLKVRSNANTNNAWELQSANDINVPLIDGVNEVWINGLEGRYTTPTSNSNDVLKQVQLTVNYIRSDNNYTGWNTWTWLRSNGVDSDSKSTPINDKKAIIQYQKESGIEKVGLILRKSVPGNDWSSKNTEQDLFVSDFPSDGNKEIWIVQNDPMIYERFEDIPSKIVSGKVVDDHTLQLFVSKPVTEQDLQQLTVENYTITNKTVSVSNGNEIIVTLEQAIQRANDIEINDPTLGTYTIAQQKQYLHSKEFNEANYYDGELGALYTPTATTFKLWAPTAKSVQVIDYTNQPEVILGEMNKQDNHWSYTHEKDANLMRYRYRATFFDGTISEFVDPYARTTTANGVFGVVIDSKNTKPENFSTERMPAFLDQSKAIIYEAHIRDLTIGENNGITNKGKFIGLTEQNTKTLLGNPSGLAYLKSLGVTHVQFLPMYDFDSVDEHGDLAFNAQYNWGYDPLHYNVPEGSYSTNPNDPIARIKEMKAMIQALHDNGIRVIMDVVYNHVYNVERSPLHQSVPGYYFRYDENGRLHNGTGVGNETASEQAMFRKYMVDSLKYWASEYNIDGFRFDLMGIHDVETMNLIRSELNKIDPSIVILGEGWDMGNHPQGVLKSNQYNAEHMENIAFFNDVFRDAVKGDNFNAANPGYVNHANNEEFGWKILNSIKSQYVVRYREINQNVLYNEAHDNYTMYDKLKQSTQNVSEEEITRMHTHATTLQALGYGILFVHAGQENLRTKQNEHNSYNLPDRINVFDYDRAKQYEQAHTFFKDLLALRKTEKLFKLNSFDEINQKMTHLDGHVTGNKIAYKVENDEIYYVVSNASNQEISVEIPSGNYETLIHDMHVYVNEETRPQQMIDRVVAKANSVTVVKLVEYADYTQLDAVIDTLENYNPENYVNYDNVTNALQQITRGLRKSKQTQVDEMKEALQTAIQQLERKPTIDVMDNGVKVSFVDGNIPEFVKIVVEKLNTALENHTTENSDVYDVKVFNVKTNQQIEYKGNALLTLPIRNGKTFKAGYDVLDLSSTLNATLQEDKVTLAVTHFSQYGIVYEDEIIKSNEDTVNPKKEKPIESIVEKKQEQPSLKLNSETNDATMLLYGLLVISAFIILILRKGKKVK